MSFSWPIEGPAYGTYYWFLREIGFAMGYGADYNTWDHAQLGVVTSIYENGYMQALYPPPLPYATQQQIAQANAEQASGEKVPASEEVKDAKTRKPHSWSFLNQLGTIETQSGKSVYDMPSDFSSNCGELVVEGVGGRIPVVSETHLRSLLAKG